MSRDISDPVKALLEARRPISGMGDAKPKDRGRPAPEIIQEKIFEEIERKFGARIQRDAVDADMRGVRVYETDAAPSEVVDWLLNPSRELPFKRARGYRGNGAKLSLTGGAEDRLGYAVDIRVRPESDGAEVTVESV